MDSETKRLLGVLHCDETIDSLVEVNANVQLIRTAQSLRPSEKDVIRAAFERGPLYDGDVPSKSARDILIREGFIVKVVVRGEEGYNACTYLGARIYRLLKAINVET